MPTRREFLKCAAALALTDPGRRDVVYSADNIRRAMTKHLKTFEDLLRSYHDDFNSIPEEKDEKMAYERALEYVPAISNKVSQLLGYQIDDPPLPEDFLRSKTYEKLAKEANADEILRIFEGLQGGAVYYPPHSAIFIGDRCPLGSCWSRANFSGIYSHELTHHAASDRETKKKLVEAMNVKYSPNAEILEYLLPSRFPVPVFASAIIEGIARCVQEDVSMTLDGTSQMIRRNAYWSILYDMLPFYYTIAEKIPHWFNTKTFDVKRSIMNSDSKHKVGGSILKMLQFYEGRDVYRDLFNGDTSGVERLLA